ncbi:MAG: 23S rRNA (guanosine(2251)-2'-O)-methyltransferase RlmB [Propionibacteriaceae bacterium]|jgi:23S rRNA (guanosine2251-2'-O)-methyltransferase|nr:23S rRNA (guanosine(2251)-2'-O)-methyltransferase RlmB [Propionibacteriaceae bacterium]
MAGNSQRKGAVRKRGKNAPAAGSGGRVRRGLEGKGPTPKAEDRVYHKAHKLKEAARKGKPAGRRPLAGDAGSAQRDWIIGRNPVLEALQAGIPVKQALIAEGVERDSRVRDILAFAAEHSIPFLTATRADLDRISGGGVHQGVALRIPPYEYADADDVLATLLETDGVAVALDSITDPHNLGAIIRSAAAFSAAGVIIPERRSAQLTPVAWKASAGAAARLPVARVKNLNQTIRAFADAGAQVIGLDANADIPLANVPEDIPVLLVVGSEGKGISKLTAQLCDSLTFIPIAAEVESLNASVATAIALYEITGVGKRG